MKLLSLFGNVCGLTGLTVVLACGEHGSVGQEQCFGASITCDLPKATGTVGVEQTSFFPLKDLPELTPTWLKRLPDVAPPPDSSWHKLLVPDAEGRLWLLVTEPAGVRVHRLSNDGDILESVLIAPPAELDVPDATDTRFASVVQPRGSGPLLEFSWIATCPGADSHGAGCIVDEWISFGESPAVNQRFPLMQAERGALIHAEDGSTWSVVGESHIALGLVADHNEPIITRYDADGAMRWRQTALHGLQHQAPLAGGAAMPNNELSLFIWDMRSLTDDLHLEWLLLSEQGNILKRRRLSGWGVPVIAANIRDTQGRPLMLSYTADRDIVVERLDPSSLRVEDTLFVREDVRLELASLDMDAVGTLYMLLVIEGRDETETRPILCRVPESAPAACFLLPQSIEPGTGDLLSIDEMVAQEAGIIYVRNGKYLTRIEVPMPK
jgi:hypothetical protein